MGKTIRTTDWSSHILGPPNAWPEALKSAVSISLNSGFPIAVYWGEDFTLLYNDAWSSIPGDKHPWALGKPGAVVWPEIWDGLKDQFNSVLTSGESIRQIDALLLMNRFGYTEECYFDYTLSPIVAPNGEIGGVFNAVIETTYKFINERRNAVLLAFWEKLNAAYGMRDAEQLVFQILESAEEDITFCVLYSNHEQGGDGKHLAGYFGLTPEQLNQISQLGLINSGLDAYTLGKILTSPVVTKFGEQVVEAMIVPISNGDTRIIGHMILGASPRKRLDNDYRRFFEAVGKQAGTILNNANANEINDAYLNEQAVNEELGSMNEELTSTNEELQKAQDSLKKLTEELENRVAQRTKELEQIYEEQQALNEELRASNEELEATNEELIETQRLLENTLNGLSESDQRFRNLVRDASVGIILLTGNDMMVEIVNDAYGALIGRTADELQNQRLFDIIPETEATFRPMIERVRETKEPLYLYEQPYVAYRDDKAINGFLDLVYQPYRDADGTVKGVMVLCQDVTEQFESKQDLERSEARFRFMLNAIPQQVWTATPDGALTYVNQVVAEDFGETGEAIVGQGWQKFIHPDDLNDYLKAWQSALSTGNQYQTEFRLLMADGSYIWHLARALPYRENEDIKLWLGTNTNIELQKNNEHKKDEFLSIASHELKTPLTSIKAFNQLMRRLNESPKMQGFIDKSGDQIFRLEKLINDLLDVTRINAGKMAYEMQPFDFKQMMEDAVESVQLKSEKHEIIIEKIDELTFTGDRLRLEQVVNNILTNAVKYSPDANKIIVNANVHADGVLVSIQDFGIGIALEHLEHLFDRYYRVDNTAMRFEGLGLGLFISSEILKRHKGSFWIESEPEKGSTFYFRLPLEQQGPEEIIDKEDHYRDAKIEIRYNKSHARLDVDWTGFQDMESVQRGGNLMLSMLAKHGVSKVLNDNTHVLGTWSEAADWAAQIWFPQMKQAGLRYFAWIYSPSTFSKLSAEKAADVELGNVQTRFFDSIAEGEAWLLSLEND